MVASSYAQYSFLGGRWSPFAQGRADKETYRTALNECLNAYPIDTGAWVRRQGTFCPSTTRNAAYAITRTFDFVQSQPYSLEFTPGHLRIWAGNALVLENPAPVLTISTVDPAVVQTSVPHGYSTGDQVEFNATLFQPGNAGALAGLAPLYNRQFAITVVDTTHFSLADPVTGASIDGSTINLAGWVLTAAKVLDLVVPYTLADLQLNDGLALRLVQNQNVALVMHPNHAPYIVGNSGVVNSLGYTVLSWQSPSFSGGPFLDPPTDGTTLTASAQSGTINLSASSIASINSGAGFQSTDVGRLIALFSQPPNWNAADSYLTAQSALGGKPDVVSYPDQGFNAAYYSCIFDNNPPAPKEPDTHPGCWLPATNAAAWTYGTITAVISTSEVTVELAAADPLNILPGGSLLYPPSYMGPIQLWQLGAYSDTTGWPCGGTFYEGRFWLFSTTLNRLDANMSDNNGTNEASGFQFAPYYVDGTVGDNCGISDILEATQNNSIFFMEGTNAGIVVGTQGGEWQLMASQLNDPITPTSEQIHRVTRYGCANIEPVWCGLSLIFVQRYQRNMYEYICDAWSGRWLGRNVALEAQDIILPGIAEIAYQATPQPIIWARTLDGRLLSMTYRRETPYGQQPPEFAGWAHHALGSGRSVVSMRSGPAPGGNTDGLTLITQDPVTSYYYVEFLSPFFDQTATILDADFVDGGITPWGAVLSGNNLTFYGLDYLNGETIAVFAAGIDLGNFTVASGEITVPVNGEGSLFTTALLAGVSGGSYGALNTEIQVSPAGPGWYSPVGSALSFTASDSPGGAYAQIAQTACFDWQNDLFYTMQGQHSGDPGTNSLSLWAFDLSTQVLAAGPLDPGNFAYLLYTCMGYDGNLYGVSASYAGRFNVETQTTDVYFALPSYAAGYNCAAIEFNGQQFVLGTGTTSPSGSVLPWWVVQMTGTPAGVGTGNTAESGAYWYGPCARGPTTTDFGSAFFAVAMGSAGIAVYQVIVQASEEGYAATAVEIGVVEPSAVSSGFTTLSLPIVQGPVFYDATDGNLIMLVEGSDSTYRIVKVNTQTAAVMWTVTVTASVDFHTSQCQFGKFSFLDGASSPYHVREIDTLTGAVTASESTTAIAPDAFSTSDLYGEIVVNVNDNNATCWETFGPASGSGPGNVIPALVYNAPVCIGFPYASEGQMLRAIDPHETLTSQGPALGKLRRAAQFSMYWVNTQGVQFGTDFTSATLHTLDFLQPGGTPLPLIDLFTGIIVRPIEDTEDYNCMPTWTITRPYPANLVAVEVFLHTSEKN